MKNLETRGKTGRVGRYASTRCLFVFICILISNSDFAMLLFLIALFFSFFQV